MDYRLYHLINDYAEDHTWLGHLAGTIEAWAIPAFALGLVALWLCARPGGDRRGKLAFLAALASASLAVLFNQVFALIWNRPRPFVAHPVDATLFVPAVRDASFPSDHAAATFAIAVAVFMIWRLAGSLFLVAATAVTVGRVVAGVHYPSDILAGALVGTVAALIVVHFGRPLLQRIVERGERLSDPLVEPLWRVLRASGPTLRTLPTRNG